MVTLSEGYVITSDVITRVDCIMLEIQSNLSITKCKGLSNLFVISKFRYRDVSSNISGKAGTVQ